MMTSTQKAIAGCALVLIIAFASIKLAGIYHARAGNRNEISAQTIGAKADAMKDQAAATGIVVKQDVARVEVSASAVAKVESERAPMVNKWKSRVSIPDALPPSAPNDRAILIERLRQANELIAKDQEDIEALHRANADKDVLIASLTKKSDEWQAVAELREKQQLAQQAATDAWKKAAVEGKWEGRAEGAVATALVEVLRLALHK
jgi:hypothetical protein